MISYFEAESICRQAAQNANLTIEQVPLSRAVGRVLADSVMAPMDIQPFDNSAMDGFAVRISDLQNANTHAPVCLSLAGIIAAEQKEKDLTLSPGTCLKIMTGAPIPLGTQAVVPVEQAVVQADGRVAFHHVPEMSTHIRKAGEDFQKGQLVLKAGVRIRAQDILPLATLGISTLNVRQQPRAFFLSTGCELADDLTQELAPGQIYNANQAYALTALTQMGVECVRTQTIADDLAAFLSFLADVLKESPTFVISSGAVSAGDFDFVRPGLEKIGAEILYHKVKIKPGKPNLLARLPNGTLYFGLPGNPIATAAGLRFFVTPAVRAIQGQRAETPFVAIAENGFIRKPGLQLFLKALCQTDENGIRRVSILPGQESFMVSPFLSANTWVVLPEDQEQIEPGDKVSVYSFFSSGR